MKGYIMCKYILGLLLASICLPMFGAAPTESPRLIVANLSSAPASVFWQLADGSKLNSVVDVNNQINLGSIDNIRDDIKIKAYGETSATISKYTAGWVAGEKPVTLKDIMAKGREQDNNYYVTIVSGRLGKWYVQPGFLAGYSRASLPSMQGWGAGWLQGLTRDPLTTHNPLDAFPGVARTKGDFLPSHILNIDRSSVTPAMVDQVFERLLDQWDVSRFEQRDHPIIGQIRSYIYRAYGKIFDELNFSQTAGAWTSQIKQMMHDFQQSSLQATTEVAQNLMRDAIDKNNIKLIEHLLNDFPDAFRGVFKDFPSLLHYLVQRNIKKNIISTIINKGIIDKGVVDLQGNTPLHILLLKPGNIDWSLFQELYSSSLLYKANNAGITPLRLIQNNPNMRQSFAQKTADPEEIDSLIENAVIKYISEKLRLPVEIPRRLPSPTQVPMQIQQPIVQAVAQLQQMFPGLDLTKLNDIYQARRDIAQALGRQDIAISTADTVEQQLNLLANEIGEFLRSARKGKGAEEEVVPTTAPPPPAPPPPAGKITAAQKDDENLKNLFKSKTQGIENETARKIVDQVFREVYNTGKIGTMPYKLANLEQLPRIMIAVMASATDVKQAKGMLEQYARSAIKDVEPTPEAVEQARNDLIARIEVSRRKKEQEERRSAALGDVQSQLLERFKQRGSTPSPAIEQQPGSPVPQAASPAITGLRHVEVRTKTPEELEQLKEKSRPEFLKQILKRPASAEREAAIQEVEQRLEQAREHMRQQAAQERKEKEEQKRKQEEVEQ